MANQHTKRAERMAAAAAAVAASPGLTRPQRRRARALAAEYAAPTKRPKASLAVSSKVPMTRKKSLSLAGELGDLFKRHGIEVHNISISEPVEVPQGGPDIAAPTLGATAAAPEPVKIEARQFELPASLDRLEGALSTLAETVETMGNRLHHAGVLTEAPPDGTGTDNAEVGPTTATAQRVRTLESRVWMANANLVHLLQRLEA